VKFTLGLLIGFGTAFLHYGYGVDLLEVGKIIAGNGVTAFSEVVQLAKTNE